MLHSLEITIGQSFLIYFSLFTRKKQLNYSRSLTDLKCKQKWRLNCLYIPYFWHFDTFKTKNVIININVNYPFNQQFCIFMINSTKCLWLRIYMQFIWNKEEMQWERSLILFFLSFREDQWTVFSIRIWSSFVLQQRQERYSGNNWILC